MLATSLDQGHLLLLSGVLVQKTSSQPLRCAGSWHCLAVSGRMNWHWQGLSVAACQRGILGPTFPTSVGSVLLSGDTQGRPDPGEEGGKLREGSGEGSQGHDAAWHMEGWQGPGAGVKSLNTVPKASCLWPAGWSGETGLVYVCLQETVGSPEATACTWIRAWPWQHIHSQYLIGKYQFHLQVSPLLPTRHSPDTKASVCGGWGSPARVSPGS